MTDRDPLGVKSSLATRKGTVYYYSLDKLEEKGYGNVARMPVTVKILVESVLRQLDGVTEHLDLLGEAADIRVLDIRNLLENDLLDLRLGQPLRGDARPGIKHEHVPDLNLFALQRPGKRDDPLLVGPPEDYGASVVEDFLHLHDFAAGVACGLAVG